MKQMTHTNNKEPGNFLGSPGLYGRLWGAFLIFLALCGGSYLHAQAPTLEWVQQMAGASATVEPTHTRVDEQGNIYMSGFFSGTATFGSFSLTSTNKSDWFIAKLDNDGRFLWVTKIVRTGAPNITPIEQANYLSQLRMRIDRDGNVYVAGGFRSKLTITSTDGSVKDIQGSGRDNSFIGKFNTDGILEWAHFTDQPNGTIYEALGVDQDGNAYLGTCVKTPLPVYLDGKDVSQVPPGILSFIGSGDIGIFKFNPSGDLVWTQRIGALYWDMLGDIVCDKDNNVLLSGQFRGSDLYVGADKKAQGQSANYYAAFVAKLDGSNGSCMWLKTTLPTNGAIDQRGMGVAVDEEGNVISTGGFSGTYNFDPSASDPTSVTLTSAGDFDTYVLKLSGKDGKFVWVKRMGSAKADHGFQVATDADGNVYTTGTISGDADFSPQNVSGYGDKDIFICKQDKATGNILWAYSIGDVKADEGMGVAVDKNGSIFFSGYFSGNPDFNPMDKAKNIAAKGTFDGYIMKLSQAPPNSIDISQIDPWSTPVPGYCKNTEIKVSYTATGSYNAGNKFTVQLSAAGGSFANPTDIGSVSATTPAIINATIPVAAATGSGYRIRVVSSDPVVIGDDNGTDFAINALPTVTATANPAAICAGDKTTLSTGGNAIAYSWNPVVPDNGFVSPATTTSYTATGTDVNGCKATATVSVKVNPLPTVTATANPAIICVGDKTTLTAGGNATAYSWNPTVPLNGVVSPATTTSYTATGTDANGCKATATVSVTVNPLPAVTASANPATICAGDKTTLSTGGNATAYSWNPTVPAGGVVSPATTTSYTATGTDTNGCKATATVNVTVNPLPTVSITANPGNTICDGDEVTLTGSGMSKSIVISWDNGIQNAQAFNPDKTTTYTVTATDLSTGCKNTDKITITVNPLPIVTATAKPGTDICEGNEVTVNGGGANTYSWNKNVTDGQAFVPAQTETYTVIGTDANGCVDSTDITVNVKDTAIVAVVDTICFGDTYTLGTQTLDKAGTYKEVFVAANGCDSTVNLDLTVNTVDVSITQNGNELKATTGATSYQWLDCNNEKQPIPSATNQAYSSDVAGDFAVVVTNGDCTDTSVCYHVVGVPKGINGTDFSRQLTLYPNPNNGRMTIASGNALANATVRVINVIGQTVMMEEHVSGNSFKVDVRQYAAGIYYVEIRDGAQTARLKFTKE